MPVVRAALVALAVALCAWFALGIRQANATRDASAIVGRPAAGGAAQARHAASLLHDAGALNPDAEVDVLRGELALQRGDPAAARRILLGVVRREPQNLQAWIALARSSSDDPRTFRLALATARRLVPAVRPPK